MANRKSLLILGTRGIPARHGGFETFAEKLALFLHSRGWDVSVYCQEPRSGSNHGMFPPARIDDYMGIRRLNFEVGGSGALSTIVFDVLSNFDAMGRAGTVLVLGYNTAVLSILLRLTGKTVVMNMDGIEWRRPKWKLYEKCWLLFNEMLGSVFCNKLIADHPNIKAHLLKYRTNGSDIVVIPYGADLITEADENVLREYGLSKNEYFISVARIEPENSILEIVKAFASTSSTLKLICLGNCNKSIPYQRELLAFASDRIIFPGAIYDKRKVQALRFFSLAYCHGHTVGGTNPSLVESLASGSAIIAHDNQFNRWVAGPQQYYFKDIRALAGIFKDIESGSQSVLQARLAAKHRFFDYFQWRPILENYENNLIEKNNEAASGPRGK